MGSISGQLTDDTELSFSDTITEVGTGNSISDVHVLIDAVYGNKPCYFSACNPSDALSIVLSSQQDALNKDFV